MKLYYSSGSCALSPHIILEEAGLAYQIEAVDLKSTPHLTASGRPLTELTDKGYVPVLQLDNGEILTEGAVIVQYLADQVPDKHLAPANGTLERYRLQEWLNFIASEIHKGFSPLWSPVTTPEVKQAALERIGKRLSLIDARLSKMDYLLGEFSVADAYLFTCVNWTNFLKVSLEPWPALLKFQARMAARPAVQRALKAEGLI
jgi:glutathione S-transferase